MNANLPAHGDHHLLDVAEQLFVRDSYHQVSIAAIAGTARVATKTIYVKFGGKRGLLQAIVERDLEDWQRQVAEIEQSGADVRDRFGALADLVLRRALSTRRAYLHADAVSVRCAEIGECLAAAARRDRQLLERLLETAGLRLGDSFAGWLLGRLLAPTA